jgi:replicative DNA helicase
MTTQTDARQTSEALYAHDEEQALVGAAIINDEAYWEAAAIVEPGDIYQEDARWVWQAIAAIRERGEDVDPITLANELEPGGLLDEIGGFAYITGLAARCPNSYYAATYAKIVRDRARRRDAIIAAERIAVAAQDTRITVDEMTIAAEEAALTLRRDSGQTRDIADIASAVADLVGDWAEHPGETRGLPTGLKPLDKLLGGLQPGLYVMAARPSMGKTAVALQIAANVAKSGRRVMLFSLEMDEQQLGLRLASQLSGVALTSVVRGTATSEELARVMDALATLSELPLEIRVGTFEAGDVRAAMQHAALVGEPAALCVVDYLGLLASSSSSDNRNLELGAMSRSLLLAAKDLGAPILALHQLNRSVDTRMDRVPQLSDLRESGHIEEDADVVLMLYRSGYYDPAAEDASVMQLWVRKNRLGGPANVAAEMYWIGDQMRLGEIHRPLNIGG